MFELFSFKLYIKNSIAISETDKSLRNGPEISVKGKKINKYVGIL